MNIYWFTSYNNSVRNNRTTNETHDKNNFKKLNVNLLTLVNLHDKIDLDKGKGIDWYEKFSKLHFRE